MIGAIIQARMSSSRLPGKVMKEIAGKPLLEYLVERLRLSRKIEKIILATSVDSSDNPVASWALAKGLLLYRGSLEDVLDRFYFAAKENSLDHIVRITGDCPLIDPEICDKLIALYEKDRADYAQLSPRFAEGLDCEVISFAALAQSRQEAQLRSEREHVTLFARNHADIIVGTCLDSDSDDSRFRITVDNDEDFAVVSSIIAHFGNAESKITATWPDILGFLAENPSLVKQNAHIERNEGLKKSLRTDSRANYRDLP